MANPKCKICGREVDRKTAYKVTKISKNYYYCSKEEYDEWLSKERELDVFVEEKIIPIVVKTVGTEFDVLCKKDIREMVSFLNKSYSLDQILGYLEYDSERISNILNNKGFCNTFSMIRYYIAVVKNNFKVVETKRPPQDKVVEDFYMAPVNYKYCQRKRSAVEMENLEDVDLDE